MGTQEQNNSPPQKQNRPQKPGGFKCTSLARRQGPGTACCLIQRALPGHQRDQTCWIPASTQPPLPLSGLDRFQISAKGSAEASGASLIKPWKRTVAR